MKHADDRTLDKLTDLLSTLRTIEGLKEKKRGIFYRKGQAFLHFHEDSTGLYADLKQASAWERFPVNTPEEQAQFLDCLGLDAEVLHASKVLQLKTEPSTAG